MTDENDEHSQVEPPTEKVVFLKDTLQHGRDDAAAAQFVSRRLQESKRDDPDA